MSVRSALVELSDITLPPRPPAASWPDVTTAAGPSALIAALPPPHAERTPGGDRMIEVTASTLAGQRFLRGLRADQLDALAAGRLRDTRTRLIARSVEAGS